jgi:23S rRNA (adenine2503-C2)-methyltransferase
MPVNKKWAIDKIMKTCYNYVKTTKRRITFEYILLQGINDRDADAVELSGKIKNILCHVNLIPVNNVPERKYKTGGIKNVNKFCRILKENGVNATVRRKCGSDINASCGQLRNTKTGE